ncbi:MAG TPA: hypothetical protein VGM53_35095 [Streptosporangiaceae bacterium]|jgi:hypothetical protein
MSLSLPLSCTARRVLAAGAAPLLCAALVAGPAGPAAAAAASPCRAAITAAGADNDAAIAADNAGDDSAALADNLQAGAALAEGAVACLGQPAVVTEQIADAQALNTEAALSNAGGTGGAVTPAARVHPDNIIEDIIKEIINDILAELDHPMPPGARLPGRSPGTR